MNAKIKMTLQRSAPSSSRWTFVGTNGGYLLWRSRNSVLYAQLKQPDGGSLWYRVKRQ